MPYVAQALLRLGDLDFDDLGLYEYLLFFGVELSDDLQDLGDGFGDSDDDDGVFTLIGRDTGFVSGIVIFLGVDDVFDDFDDVFGFGVFEREDFNQFLCFKFESPFPGRIR